jgi:hypothetical protein
MNYNSRRTLSDVYEVAVFPIHEDEPTGVLLPGGIVFQTDTKDPAEAAAEALRWFCGLDDDEVKADELEFRGEFSGTRHYRFHV